MFKAMTSFLTLAQLGAILDVTPSGCSDDILSRKSLRINTDTRTLQPLEIFLALRGDNFDGHLFLSKAQELGAIAAIVDTQWECLPSNFPLFRVEDTLKAYHAIAHWFRNQFPIPVIAVTGSVGKTTTKELISAVLATTGNVLKTQLNYNNEIGVPKTLLELSSQHQFAVIEMGMRGPGEIALLSQIARPTIAVITNVGTAHIGRLGSEQAIAEAKCELLAEMPSNSVAILNNDNPRLIKTAARVWQGKTVTYGLEGGDIHGELLDQNTLKVDDFVFPLPFPGQHNALNYLAAIACAKVLGISWEPLTQGLNIELPDGRAKRFTVGNDILVLNETYNAGLESMLASLKLLAETPGKRHIAVLGTMKELGEKSVEFHHQVGQFARQLNLDGLFILADFEEAQGMATGAGGLSFLEIEDITSENAHDNLANHLKEFVQEGDRVLFKASHSVELNRVVEKFRNLMSA
jgi:UDP-N-acetylmuramoyl-tripeptide--D-alanyl-D-alanine ligase